MKTKPTLELRDVENGLKAGLAKAAEKGWAVTVSVVDDGGHLLGLKRMDGCAAVAAYISPEKARTAALGQRGSGGYEKMINDGRTAFLCVDVLKGTLEGGLPIVIDGQVAGAVGVSGVKPNEDLEVAQAAVDAIVAGAWWHGQLGCRPSGSGVPGCHAVTHLWQFCRFAALLRSGRGARLDPARRGIVV